MVGVWDGDSWDLSQQFQTSSQHNPNRRCSIKLPSYLFGENHYYYIGEKLDDKFDDELGDQFNESPIIVTNIG